MPGTPAYLGSTCVRTCPNTDLTILHSRLVKFEFYYFEVLLFRLRYVIFVKIVSATASARPFAIASVLDRDLGKIT